MKKSTKILIAIIFVVLYIIVLLTADYFIPYLESDHATHVILRMVILYATAHIAINRINKMLD